jgi:transposase
LPVVANIGVLFRRLFELIVDGHYPGQEPADHLRRDGACQRPRRYQVARKPSSATFTAFLEYLLVAYPVAPKVAVICDNTIIHRSQFVQRWLAAPARGGGVVRGTLQPHDNPVERVWRR